MKCGIDLVEHKRIEPDKLKDRILSSLELEYYNTIKNKKRQVEYVASRFAVKEAVFKVYVKSDGSTNYKDISVLNDEFGAPYILCDKISDSLSVSLSHSDDYSVAIVILQ